MCVLTNRLTTLLDSKSMAQPTLYTSHVVLVDNIQLDQARCFSDEIKAADYEPESARNRLPYATIQERGENIKHIKHDRLNG